MDILIQRSGRNSGLRKKQNGNGTTSQFLLLSGLMRDDSILRVSGERCFEGTKMILKKRAENRLISTPQRRIYDEKNFIKILYSTYRNADYISKMKY